MAFMTPYWSFDSIIILIISVTIAYFYMTRKFRYWKKRGVSEISPTPFLGNFAECVFMKKSPGWLLKDFYDQADGKPYIGFFIFDKPFLLVRDHEMIKNVLVRDFNHFSDRYFLPNKNDRLAYANLFFIKNPVWKMLRMKMTSFFTSAKLKNTLNLIDECATNLVEYLNSMNLEDKGKIVDVKGLSSKFTTDVIASTAFGLNTNSFKYPDAEFCRHGNMIFSSARTFEMLASTFMPTLTRFIGVTLFGVKTDAFLRKVFWETITQRIESGKMRHDLIDILIELKRNHGDKDIEGFKFNGDDLVSQAAIFFAAAFDTSSTTMAFVLYELALNPEIQDKLRKEIFQSVVESDGKITYEMIMSLPYLEMVFLEVLRIYPPVEYLHRATTEVYNMPSSNLIIEKDTPIFISVRGLHNDPKYFPDPDKFDPERFNEENIRKRPMYVHLPFGAGPHMCIGTRMGLLNMKLALVKILSNFEVTPCEKTLIPMKYNPTGTLTTPLEGVIYLNMRKIINNEELQIM